MDIETLFETYHDEIYRYLWRLSRDDSLTADLTQETFLKALPALHKLPPESNYRAWLYRIAANTQHDYWRQQKRRIIMDIDMTQLAASGDIESGYEQQEQLRLVAAAVIELPEKQRQALILHRYQELAYADIAQILEISEDSARANVYQALKKLRERFSEGVKK